MSKSRGKSKGTVAGRLRRDEVKEREWRKLLEEQRRGDESVRAFCRERQLREASFYRWRREIGLRDREVAGGQKKNKSRPVLAPVVFVEEPCGSSAKSREIFMDDTSPTTEGRIELTAAKLAMLLEGIDFTSTRKRKRYRR